MQQALKAAFRPEFLNRIDEIITFHALERKHLMDIAAIQIAALNRRLAARNLAVHLDDDAMTFLAQKGYAPGFGARPLKRVIQQEIENPLSMALLKGEYLEGETVHFCFDREKRPACSRSWPPKYEGYGIIRLVIKRETIPRACI